MSILKDFYEDNYTKILILEETLQEIKKIANYWQNRRWNDIDERQGFDEILDLIIKAEIK